MKVINSWRSEACDAKHIDDWMIAVEFDSGAVVNVQFAGGDYKPSMGCECFAESGAEDISGLVDAAIDAASSFVEDETESRFTVCDLGFNSDFCGVSFFLRVESDGEGEAHVVAEESVYDAYKPRLQVLKSFDSKEAALDFASGFRTDEHYDAAGLKAMLDEINLRGES